MQDIGIKVHSVRPRNRAGDLVKPDFRKAVDGFEGLEHPTVEQPFEVEFPDESIGEGCSSSAGTLRPLWGARR